MAHSHVIFDITRQTAVSQNVRYLCMHEADDISRHMDMSGTEYVSYGHVALSRVEDHDQ